MTVHLIPPASGQAFAMGRGDELTIVAPDGEQVADLMAFNRTDTREAISSGRTLDYTSTIYPTTGHALYSNRSNVMFLIVADSVGRHDFLLTPCSTDTFRLLYESGTAPTRGCLENLADALAPFGVVADHIPNAFNVFMNVQVNGETGALSVLPPVHPPGSSIKLRAEMDLIVGLTACSAPMSNGGKLKPITYSIDKALTESA